PGRPMIHVAGDWHPTATPPDLARARGTVEMVSSGDSRWTLISFREDGQGQWSSEGVQLGGLDSAMGVICSTSCRTHSVSPTFLLALPILLHLNPTQSRLSLAHAHLVQAFPSSFVQVHSGRGRWLH
ncbi:hypothetical protein F5148DRAFT_984835, partial [Russula earlei]